MERQKRGNFRFLSLLILNYYVVMPGKMFIFWKQKILYFSIVVYLQVEVLQKELSETPGGHWSHSQLFWGQIVHQRHSSEIWACHEQNLCGGGISSPGSTRFIMKKQNKVHEWFLNEQPKSVVYSVIWIFIYLNEVKQEWRFEHPV